MINQINASASLLYQTENTKKTAAKDTEKTASDYESAFSLDISVTSEMKGSKALGTDQIEDIMDQVDATTSALKDVVEKLIVGQKSSNTSFSMNMQILTAESSGAADISQDPEWGVEAVSNRILDFAKSLAGGDKSKIEMLREAIDKGFASAKKTLGGKLPSVSMDTYDAVMQKLDDWGAETDSVTTEAAETAE